MKYNRQAIAAICCRAWGITPVEYADLLKTGKVTFPQVMTQVYLEMMCNPLMADRMARFVWPEAESDRQSKHDKTNSETFEALKAIRDRNKAKK